MRLSILCLTAWLLLGLGAPLGAQSDSLAVLRRENDSLRARIRVLNGAVRDLIQASSAYATQARNAEALLSWYRNRPDRCVAAADST